MQKTHARHFWLLNHSLTLKRLMTLFARLCARSAEHMQRYCALEVLNTCKNTYAQHFWLLNTCKNTCAQHFWLLKHAKTHMLGTSGCWNIQKHICSALLAAETCKNTYAQHFWLLNTYKNTCAQHFWLLNTYKNTYGQHFWLLRLFRSH